MTIATPVRVLVVDDNAELRATMRAILGALGHAVAGEAENGARAIALTQRLKPDIIVMDVSMPGMDGITAARQIQVVQPTPVILLTAMDTPELVEQARDAGVVAYLVKPPEASELQRVITITLARSRESDELRRLNAELRRLNQELNRVNAELEKRNQQLQRALKTIKTLSGLVPICAWCGKKIQDDDGQWTSIEHYIEKHSDAEFTHGICPECLAKFKKELGE
ncbi:MAG TPA: response regulator [Anaerolineae bacterium]|nr:response regulator [Anaerolineae bacterium]HQI85484.1 response regulator [Anaerolineae bacterium]